MPPNDEELLKRLRETFRVEAQEHLQAIAAGLIELERPDAPADALERVLRAAHSLKGAARAVNVSSVESLCQPLEGVLAALRNRGAAPSAELFDLLHRCVDMLSRLLAALDASAPAPSPASISDLRRALHTALSNDAPPPRGLAVAEPLPQHPPAAAPVRALPDSVRVRKRTLDAVLLRSEELLFAKVAAAQRAESLQQLQRRPAPWRKRWAALRADARSVDAALATHDDAAQAAWQRLREYVDASQDFVAAIESDLLRLARAADHEQRVVGGLVDQLLDEMKQVAVQPFSTVLDLFAPSVRELARDRGKEIDLVVQGAEIEIDRRILDDIKDPLIHLVRNGVDHGIEVPSVRVRKGKPARGTLTLAVRQHNGHEVEILVSDDGAGIDNAALARAAVKAGLRSDGESASLSSAEALALACEPGISTSPVITDLSGRGLGLAIVKQQVERLNGSLTLDSATPGAGARFRIVLPVTLARFRGVLVRVGRASFVLPTRSVERVARIRADGVKTIENRDTVVLGGQTVALVRLDRVLGLDTPPPPADEARFPAVVLAAPQSIAFRVDEVVDEREVLVKPLGRPLERVRHIAGASVFASGQVVPILNPAELVRTAILGADRAAAAPATGAESQAGKAVLVAEDSITSRTLLKGILEGAGYRVETAADGIDAFTALRSGEFDILVSDVDMPRLDGFGLTAKVRADKKLAELPVVLVTALDSRADREHGIDVGASAYIVKSTFDQTHLLEVVRRLS